MSKRSSCIDNRASLSLPIFLALEIRQIPSIFIWLDVQSVGVLDTAVSNHNARESWLIVLKSTRFHAIDEWRHSDSSMRWAILRDVIITQVLVDHNHRYSISDLTFEAVIIDSYGGEANGDRVLAAWEGCRHLLSLHLSDCQGITDIGVSALGRG
jgi:Leucine Rich repeat